MGAFHHAASSVAANFPDFQLSSRTLAAAVPGVC